MASDDHDQKPPAEQGFVLGAEHFEKISAVEGIELSDAMHRRAKESERLGHSAEERIAHIKRAYRKG
ncbi:conserved hypothetical protein [Rhodopseudomonas palustris HaA2]|uniref:Uncharacterized protein n=1 Tax=Rhodopseudomonas palustris (strain HaA2) TaxID=316058 RepID=Q2IYM0_RHOP2|nr:hypothetical protein [Rhodopseudomonas palustris]ABD06690.1 conserved hypothetical protein [Rhodopseudomonas palustris HaA2]